MPPARGSAVAALLLVLALAGCTPSDRSASGTSSASPTIAVSDVDQGYLQRFLDENAASLGVYGAAMLLRTPNGEWSAVYGSRDAAGTDPVTIADHIRIGSNTKTMTGTVILQLAQEGALSLDDPVSAYRPEVPGGDAITIGELLTMRSGLGNYTETYAFNAALDADPLREWHPDELTAMGLALPPYFPPGTGYHYSNTNYVLLGLIAEQVTGQPLEQLMQDRLFGPLGLEDTILPAASSNDIAEPFARGYDFGTNVLTIQSTALPPDLILAAREGTLAPVDHTMDNPSWAWAAGGGISTAADLADWVAAMADGDLLDAAMQEQRMGSLRPTADAPGAPQYGFAIARLGPMYGHTGELPGYNSFMGHDPATGTTLVVWANLAPTPEGNDPATTIARTFIDTTSGL